MNTLPPTLASKLAHFRRQVWTVKGSEALLRAAFAVLLSFSITFLLERWFDTPTWLRAGLFSSSLLVFLIGVPVTWYRWVWRQRRLEDAAKLIRRRFPRMGDQLLGIVELAQPQSATTVAAPGHSPRLIEAAMQQAEAAVQSQDFTAAVPTPKHRRWALRCGVLALLIGITFGLQFEAASNSFQRWATAWKQTDRFTFARITPAENPWIIPLSESIPLQITLSPHTLWTPGTATLNLTGQVKLQSKLDPLSNSYQFLIPPQSTSNNATLRVGDLTQTLAITPQPRPELTELLALIQLPSYLQYQKPVAQAIRGASLSLLPESTATLQLTAATPIASASIDDNPQPVANGKIQSLPIPAPTEATDKVLRWSDSHGLSPKEPITLTIQPLEDQAPQILARRDSNEQVILDTEVVTLDLSATDDFGISRIGLSWSPLNPNQLAGPDQPTEKITAAGQPESRELTARATFCAAREGISPQSLQLRAWAEDYLPDRPRSHSATFTLHILNATDHAQWLTQQFGKWLDVAKETYEREQQLHQSNLDLRSLSADQLDQPGNRRKVADQAAAEQANAARLSSLNQAGKRLIDQATRNTEFDAERLESLATLMKSLQNIAEKRMPSVADLLKQSANASNQTTPSASDPTAATKNPGENAKSANPSDPSSEKPNPGDSQPTTKDSPNIAQGPKQDSTNQTGAPKAGDQDDQDKPSAPSIRLTEKSDSTSKAAPSEPKKTDSKPSSGKLSLPSLTLGPAPGSAEDKATPPPAESPAQAKLDESIWEQRDLLAEFAQVSDQLNDILASLEASTFVKRLKAASQEQWQLAAGLQRKTLESFGISPPATAEPAESETADPAEETAQEGGTTTEVATAPPPAPAADAPALPAAEDLVAALEQSSIDDARSILSRKSGQQSEVVRIIQSDLDAYTQRRPDDHIKKVLGQMKEAQVSRALAKVGNKTQAWLSGQAITGAEYWADTLDRWAEELVAAGQCSSCSAGDSDSLPPEIVLKVMQTLRDEMKLRDETRELETAKAALPENEFPMRSTRLSSEQSRIAIQVQSAFEDILHLPGGNQKFGKELQLLGQVRHIMDEVVGLLDQPETGAPTIAAETEAIELLLQAKRPNPNGGGGGGGGSPGGGSGAESASSTALAELDAALGSQINPDEREVGQSTGRSGREFPEEFRSGLDSYFNQLETQQAQ
jgi:hypothetical protein